MVQRYGLLPSHWASNWKQHTTGGWEAFLVSPGGTKSKWRSTEKNRTNTSWEGDPRKKDAMAWSRHENGWSTHSETSATLGSCGIQERTWQTKDELERCGKEGPPRNVINLGRGWSISSTFVPSTCGPMHRWCWMNQGQGQAGFYQVSELWTVV